MKVLKKNHKMGQFDNQKDIRISTWRRRGRPSGSNRVPLSHEEQKARNALYEKERRQEMAAAMRELTEAVNCSENSTKEEVLTSALALIRGAENNMEYSIEDLHRINRKLEAQIVLLQQRLGLDDESFDKLEEEEFLHSTSVSHPGSQQPIYPEAIQAMTEPSSHSNNTDIGHTILPALSLLTENEMHVIFRCIDTESPGTSSY